MILAPAQAQFLTYSAFHTGQLPGIFVIWRTTKRQRVRLPVFILHLKQNLERRSGDKRTLCNILGGNALAWVQVVIFIYFFVVIAICDFYTAAAGFSSRDATVSFT